MNKCYLCNGETKDIGLPRLDLSITGDNRVMRYPVALFQCLVCGHMQKFPSKKIINKIYSNYVSDVILPHREQIKFDQNGIARSRSYFVFENLYSIIKELGKEEIKILDIGAGSGDALRNFASLFPKAKTYAYDINDNNKEQFLNIANFQEFYTDIDSINEVFDCIVAFHSLIHDEFIMKTFSRIFAMLGDQGLFIMQVPNIQENLWDVFLYETCHHFTREMLKSLFLGHGYNVFFPKKQVFKEITIVGKKNKKALLDINFSVGEHFDYPIYDLFKNVEVIKNIAVNSSQQIAIFGSAICSTLVAFILISFRGNDSGIVFLDEDERKIGKSHYAIPIIAPKDYNGNIVLLPYGGFLRDKVKDEYSSKWNLIEIF